MSENQYPLNFDSLTKGQEFSDDQLAQILGCSKTSRAFRFAVMGLQARIHSKTGFTSRITQGGLRILTDVEAFKYNHRRHLGHKRGMMRRHLLALEVDAAQLSEEQKKEHEQNLIVQGRNVQALLDARHGKTLPRPDLPQVARIVRAATEEIQ